MACQGGRVSQVPGNTNVFHTASNSGNPVDGPIPIKVGQPLSTACERGYVMGAIPEVIRHPAFTLTNGAVTPSRPSSGGVQNPKSFFKTRKGCYYDKNVQLPSTCA